MSTIKTVLTTASVLFLGAVITAGYQVSVYQQNQIDRSPESVNRPPGPNRIRPETDDQG